MNYCSVVDVRNALAADGQTSGTNTAADMDDSTLTDSIAEASSVVDTYVGGPYSPADSVPGMVIYWTRDIAAFLATCVWRRSKDFETLDPVLLRYQQAVARLAGLFDGTTAMPSSQMPTSDIFTGAVYNLYAGQLIFPYQFDLYGNSISSGVSGGTMTGWPYQNQWPGYMY
jgi:phage gp36-like protein